MRNVGRVADTSPNELESDTVGGVTNGQRDLTKIRRDDHSVSYVIFCKIGVLSPPGTCRQLSRTDGK